MKRFKYPSVLTIAGSDSGGGAGIQADLKTFAALGCFGTTAITAITVQNTLGVAGIHSVPPEIVSSQITAVVDDIQPLAIKIGMIHTLELCRVIRDTLRRYPHIPIVLDTVMVATSGDKLILDETVSFLKQELFPLAAIVTPNLDEAGILCNTSIAHRSDMVHAAKEILNTGCQSVLIKGGHLKSKRIVDVYMHKNGKQADFESRYINTCNVHGTGCTLSSAIAAYLALENSLENSVRKARTYTRKAIKAGKDVKTGHGNGPLNHFFHPQKLYKYEME